jgi:hypothetical protein
MLPLDLLKIYWKTIGIEGDAASDLDSLAAQIVNPIDQAQGQ